jgi:uncharacterized integral membrane protein (TIGR00697 family)
MKKTIIGACFITGLVLANVVAGKIIDFGWFLVSGGAIFYSITFLGTDLYAELYGKEETNKLVTAGFAASVFAAILLYITQILPVASFRQHVQDAYVVLLGTNIRFVLASMIAYLSSQYLDVKLFTMIKEKTQGKHKWLRNNGSTIVSQFVDTLVFTSIAFLGAVPMAAFLPLVIGRYVAKIVIALIDTPIFYLLTMESKKS